MRRMTEKQKRFADAYIKYGDAAKAAREAGYSKRTARMIGSQNLTKLYIKSYINKRLKQIEDAKIPTLKEVMEYLGAVMRGKIGDHGLTVTGKVVEMPASLQRRNEAAKELMKRLSAGKTEELTTQKILQAMAGIELTKKQIEQLQQNIRIAEQQNQQVEGDNIKIIDDVGSGSGEDQN